MPVTIFSIEELRQRTLNRIDGERVDFGAEHFQIGTCTLELEPVHAEQLRLQKAVERWVRRYVKQYNRDKPKDRPRMIGARVMGLEIQKLYE